MTIPSMKVVGSIKALPLHMKLALGFAAVICSWGALVLSTKLANQFNASLGVTQQSNARFDRKQLGAMPAEQVPTNARFNLEQLRALPTDKLPTWDGLKSKTSPPQGAKLNRDKVLTIAAEAAPKLNPHSADCKPGAVAYSREVKCWVVYFSPAAKGSPYNFAILIHDSDNSTELIPG
jgi:hypothetical protein